MSNCIIWIYYNTDRSQMPSLIDMLFIINLHRLLS
ncbi:UNVERIFIED_CONTAM: hypothetical protein GTU68_046291 [Idotea baltica]|nr:hypothetical protein [Idotea baltica]